MPTTTPQTIPQDVAAAYRNAAEREAQYREDLVILKPSDVKRTEVGALVPVLAVGNMRDVDGVLDQDIRSAARKRFDGCMELTITDDDPVEIHDRWFTVKCAMLVRDEVFSS